MTASGRPRGVTSARSRQAERRGRAMGRMSRRSMLARTGAGLAVLGLPTGTAAAHGGHPGSRLGRRSRALVIGHRGAPAYRPEHTIASYTLAIEMGADYIEPDLVSTKDHQLVARHENDIGGTTDVATRGFDDRRTTKTIDGVVRADTWFTEDFTLAELKTLQEVIDLAKQHGVGIYPETKHPSYFDSIGLSLEEPLVEVLRRNRLDRRGAKVFVQSFEVSNLQELSRMTRVPLVQLIDARGAPADFVLAGDPRTYDDLVTPQGLAEIARYADGIGPEKSRIVPGNVAGGTLGEPTSLIADAHRAGLVVHPFTFRPENNFLAATFRQGNPSSPEYLRARGDQPAELALYYELGVDGLFADNPDTAVAVRETLRDDD